ncbi:DNA polymerase IV [Elongatibacter sediminis]|uniref:DNA polymerase IV n=1 Tax=Elongatibacter sediminis TaxID=3119006 RepID=A0AAW9R7C4_9GAMM
MSRDSESTADSPPALSHRAILHVDMDAFYASVEERDRPELAGKPLVVGGLGPRGVVSTANYAARQFGVHSAMPMARARRLCPQAVYLRPRMDCYREESARIFSLFRRYTPRVEGLSLDEAFLDVSGSLRLFGSAEAIARRIKTDIHETTGLTASVGVAHNKFLAKLASDLQKPDGLVCVPADAVHGFLDPMPIRRLWGIGPRTEPKLKAQGLLTFGQLRRADEAVLRSLLGKRAEHFRRLASGEDDREVVSDSPDKSISHEVTFDTDLTELQEMRAELQHLTDLVAARLRRRQLLARTVVVKIRDPDFRTVTRSRSMPAGTDATQTVYHLARALFDGWRKSHPSTPVRLLGVGVSGLDHHPGPDAEPGETTPMPLDGPDSRPLDALMDSINRRYGGNKIVHGQTLRRRRGDS